MSVLAAVIVAMGVLISSLCTVAAVAAWADRRPLGRKPVIILVACLMGIIVQLPLPDGPSFANVPTAFAILMGELN